METDTTPDEGNRFDAVRESIHLASGGPVEPGPHFADRPTPSARNKRDQLLLEYAARMEEYRALKAEINETLNTARRVSQLVLLGLTGLISVSGYIIKYDLPIIYLVAPFLFYALIWLEMKYYYVIRRIGDYIIGNVAVRVGKIIKEIGRLDGNPPANSSAVPKLFVWESLVRDTPAQHQRDKMAFVMSSHLIIPLLSCLLAPLAYLAYIRHYYLAITPLYLLLVLVNEGCFLYTLESYMWLRCLHRGEVEKGEIVRRHSDYAIAAIHHFVVVHINNVKRWREKRKQSTQEPPTTNEDKSSKAKPASPGLPYINDPVKPDEKNRYRNIRAAIYGLVIVLTWGWIGIHNMLVEDYDRSHLSTIYLVKSAPISGTNLGIDGSHYIVIENENQRVDIDTSAVASIGPYKPPVSKGPIPLAQRAKAGAIYCVKAIFGAF